MAAARKTRAKGQRSQTLIGKTVDNVPRPRADQMIRGTIVETEEQEGGRLRNQKARACHPSLEAAEIDFPLVVGFLDYIRHLASEGLALVLRVDAI